MSPPLAIVCVASILALAACGTKTPLALPPGPGKPPLLGGPVLAPPAAVKPAPTQGGDDSAGAEKR